MFAKGSRYEQVPTAIHRDAAGRETSYVLLRILPEWSGGQRYAVRADDRLDLLAFRCYDDPEQFWRICDANQALWPDDLMAEVGRMLRIPHGLR